MITIKLPIQNPSKSFLEKISLLQREYSCLVRTAYNRLGEGYSNKQVRTCFKEMLNINDLGCELKEGALIEAKAIIKSKNELGSVAPVLFGGKYNFKQKTRKKISKEQYRQKRTFPISSIGEAQYYGNRYFSLDIINNNKIIFKSNRKEHFDIFLPKLRKNIKKELFHLEQACELKETSIPYTIKLNKEFIYISFDVAKLKNNNEKYSQNRILGIDLNPSNIGVSVLEFNNEDSFQILDKQVFFYEGLLKKSGEKSSSNKSKYLHNKLEFEIYEICKKIISLAREHYCNYIAIEDLAIKTRDNKKGKEINRRNNNLWIRSKLVSNLKKRTELNNISALEVNPFGTSIIGNLQYENPDSINASIEIARRAFLCFVRKKKAFYPEFWIKPSAEHLWKETAAEKPDNWKDLVYFLSKNPKLKYRVSLAEGPPPASVFSLNSIKSKVFLYTF